MKRVHGENIIRKRKEEQSEPKRRRVSYLENHLLTFDLSHQFRVDSKKTPNDCFICTLEYLSILDKDTAKMLRAFVTEKGIHPDQMLNVLNYTLKDTYGKIQYELIPFDSIYQLFDLLAPSTATIIGLQRTSMGIGHVVLLAKDIHSHVGIIDAQINQTCVGKKCDEYVAPYLNRPLLIFTHS